MTTLTTDLQRLGSVKAPRGFADRLLAHVGMADSYARFNTVLGPVYVAWNRNGVSAAARMASAEEFEQWFRKDVGRQLSRRRRRRTLRKRSQTSSTAGGGCASTCVGSRRSSRRCCARHSKIPRGQVRPYGWIAREIGHPAAVRAVGTALANNPIPYFIPCHRVVRTDGKIGNYGGGGPEAKRSILTLEGVQLKRLEDFAHRGYRYEGVRTTKVFCFPTCYHGKSANERNVVRFHDEAEARAAGYRPCKHCRPAAA